MNKNSFQIDKHRIGLGRCFIIGEIAQAHDGSLGMAHAYIDSIAKAGADAVKFQTHIAEAESSEQEPWRVKFSPQDDSRFKYWKRMEFTPEQWVGLKDHAEAKGLVFLSSPFSIEAVDLLEKIGIVAWKVASGEVTNPLLIKRMASTGKPVLISSGMTSMEELDNAVELVRTSYAPVAVMQCTSSYPTPPGSIGLNLLAEFRDRYACPVGLSDHSGGIYAGLAAVTLGASLLEMHVTMSREMFGPDVVASITTDELSKMVEGVRFIEEALANPIDKDIESAKFYEYRDIFMKSLFFNQDLIKGTIVAENQLIAKKPGNGVRVENINEVIGKVLKRNVKKGDMLKMEYLNEVST